MHSQWRERGQNSLLLIYTSYADIIFQLNFDLFNNDEHNPYNT